MGSTLGRVDVEVALVKHKGLVGVFDVDVAVGDVVDASVADVLASPGLEASAVLDEVSQICVQVAWVTELSAYLAVEKGDVLDVRMLDDVLYARVLSDAAHTHTVGVVAPEVLHKYVGCVGLRREAIVPNVDSGVGDAESVHVERVKAVGVLGQSL